MFIPVVSFKYFYMNASYNYSLLYDYIMFFSNDTTHERELTTQWWKWIIRVIEVTANPGVVGCWSGSGWHLLQYFRHNSGRHSHVCWLLGIRGGHISRWEQGVIRKDNKTARGDGFDIMTKVILRSKYISFYVTYPAVPFRHDSKYMA